MEEEDKEQIDARAAVTLNMAVSRTHPRIQEDVQEANLNLDNTSVGAVQEDGAEPRLGQYTHDYSRAGEVVNDEVMNEQTEMQREADGGFINHVKRQFWHGGNIAVNIGREVYRKATAGEADPSWGNEAITQWLDSQAEPISPEQRWRYYGTINVTEAAALKADADSDIRAAKINEMRGGFESFAAGALAGLVDIDTPLTVLSGGLSATAKMGINATRAGRLLSSTIAGTSLGLGLGTVDYAVNPNSDMESIMLMGIMGGGFGLAGGVKHGAARVDATAGMRNELAEDLGAQVHDGPMPPRDAPVGQRLQDPPEPASDPGKPAAQPVAETGGASGRKAGVFKPEDAVEDPGDFLTGGGSSAGAKQVGKTYDGLGASSITSADSKQILGDSTAWVRQSPEIADWDDPSALINNAASAQHARAAIRFREMTARLGVGTDFDTFMRSGLNTAMRFANMTMESASGVARGASNAAVGKEAYFKEIQNAWRPYSDAFNEWKTVEQGIKRWDWVKEKPGTGSWVAKDKFNEQVVNELMNRKYGGTSTASPSVLKAADAWDKAMAKEHEIGLGRTGEIPLAGYDKFKAAPGYVPQRWSGRKMQQMLDSAKSQGTAAVAKMKLRLVKAIDQEYAIQSPSWDPVQRQKVAAAVVDRALASRRGFQRDLISLLNGDEGDFIRAALERQGVSKHELENVIKSITGSREQKTQLGQVQHRQDVDFRSVSTDGVRMMDMLETDLELLMGRRAGQTSGLAALARQGIPDKVTYEKWKKAILDEQEARGKLNKRAQRTTMDKVDDLIDEHPEITAEHLDAIYGYYSGIRPGAGQGIDATVQRIKKITQLSLMNQLGLTSTAEYGAIAGQVGLERFFQHVGTDMKNAWLKQDSPLMAEMKHFSVFVPEEGLFSARLLHDLDRADGGILQGMDAILNKGSEIQGHISGFYAVRASQQRIAISSVTARLFEGVQSGKGGFNAQRLHDMGFEPDFVNRNLKHAQFDGKGNLEKLNMDQWTPEDVQTFQQNMARVTNQLVQKAMIGESNWAFHSNGLAQLFWQLKSFPLLAINKQYVRNAKMADMGAMSTTMYGIITAAMAFGVKEVINGRGDKLDTSKLVHGALNYSNMTGWLPMFADPVLGAIGSDASLSGYSSRGVGSVIAVPASFDVLDRLSQTIGATAKVAGSAVGATEYKNSDIRILQAMPLLGNLYGMNWLLNSMKHDPAERAAERKREKAETAAKAKKPEPGSDEELKQMALDAMNRANGVTP